MKKLIKKYGILAFGLLLSAGALQACYVDAHDRCYQDVYYTDVCSYDAWGNAYDCTRISKTQEICDNDYGYSWYNEPGCYYSWECSENSVCIDGRCVGTSYGVSGYVQTCGACSSAGECYGNDSACTILASGERVCTMACTDTARSMDCPQGYKCTLFSGISQCLPLNDSCDPNYCQTWQDCGMGNVDCVNNRCVANYNNGDNCANADCRAITGDPELDICYVVGEYSYCTKSCSHDIDCGAQNGTGYACALTAGDRNAPNGNALDSGVCVVAQDAYCQFSRECPDGLVCVSGRCAAACSNDAECRNSTVRAQPNGRYDQDYHCENGYCIMNDYHQYFEW